MDSVDYLLLCESNLIKGKTLEQCAYKIHKTKHVNTDQKHSGRLQLVKFSFCVMEQFH